jgi:hypothetical protein
MVYLTTNSHPARSKLSRKSLLDLYRGRNNTTSLPTITLKKCMQIDFLGKDARATCGLLPLGFAAGIRRHTIWNKVKESMMTYTSDRELQFARHNPSTCRSKNVIFISISTADYVVWTPSGRPLSLILSLLPLDAQGWANFGATWSVAVRFRNCCTHRPF